jgi:Sec-independent protein secretion pathway component TatC
VGAAQLSFACVYPIVAYALLRPIVLAEERRRVVIAEELAIVASALFAVGALFGYVSVVPSLLRSVGMVGLSPVLGAPSFYFATFKVILTMGMIFSLPAYAYAIATQARAGFIGSLTVPSGSRRQVTTDSGLRRSLFASIFVSRFR